MIFRQLFLKGGIPCLLALAGSTICFADSNGTAGGLITFERKSLGAGPFSHGASAGSPDNSIGSATFTGGFTANRVLIEGDLTGLIEFNGSFFLGEADIIGTPALGAPGSAGTFTWQNPLGTVPNTTGTLSYSASANLGTPGDVAGAWNFEFIDTFDDGAGADSISENVFVEFQQFEENQDFDGFFSLGSLTGSDPAAEASSVGEFLLEGIFDQYTLTLTNDGTLDFSTELDPGGIAGGVSFDTEIAIFDSTGLQIAYDDDSGTGLYSSITGLDLTAGDYTLVVSGFGSNINAGSTGTLLLGDVTGGTATGDYQLNVSYFSAVPEPSSMLIIGLGGLLTIVRRRR